MLLDQTAGDELDIWRAYARCFEGELCVKRADFAAGLQQLRAGLDQLRRARFVQYLTTFLGGLAEGLAAAGDAPAAKATIDEAIARSEQGEERWCSPELLRIRGAVVLRRGANDAAGEAEEDFLASIGLARTQEALAWELRTTISLARLRRDQGRIGEAHELLSSVYGRFGEGYETNDLRLAKRLL